MPYNCSACGKAHDTMTEIQACHAAKKQASSIDTMAEAMVAENKAPDEVEEQEVIVEETPVAAKYRKLPVVIDAYQTQEELQIETLEGTMTANPGDWIIKGVNGELYPCKPDIFAKTYEPAEDEYVTVEIPDLFVVTHDEKGKYIIPPEHLPDVAKYLSIGQYMALKILGVLRKEGLIVQESEVLR